MRPQARRSTALAVLLAACRPDPAPTVTPAEPVTDPNAAAIETTEGFHAWLAVEGVGATEAEAEQQAREQLAARLLGDPAWLQLFDVDVHDPDRDEGPVVTSREDGEVHVALGLSKVRAVEVVSAMDMGEAAVVGPAAWHDTLYAYLSAHAAAHVCERRRELFDAECEPAGLAEVDAALAELAGAVAFVPEFSGGLPTDAAGAVLRVPEVFVMQVGAPLADVPVVVRADTTVHGKSDELGRVAIAGDPAGGVTIEVDADKLLGPLAEAWPTTALKLDPRPLDATRYRVFAEKDKRANELLRAFNGALEAALGHAGDPRPEVADRDLAPKAEGRTAWLRGLTGHGKDPIDYVVIVGGHWGFASRMGGGRVWYEASGFLEVARAWDGESVARVQTTVRANGVGDRQAETEAKAKLVETLVAEVRAQDGSPWAESPDRVSRSTVGHDG